VTPTELNTFRSRPWHSGQMVSDESLNSWWMSNAWPQSAHRYA
jgi:hypothetical protein